MSTAENTVNYHRLAVLSEEFFKLWSRLQAFYLDAVAGFDLVRNSVEADQARARMYVAGTQLDSEEFQDTRQFTYAQIFFRWLLHIKDPQSHPRAGQSQEFTRGREFHNVGSTLHRCFFW